MAQNDRLRSKKVPIFAKFRTFASKTRFGCFLRFGPQKERKSILGDFWLRKRAQKLMFSTVWRSVRKRRIFAKKLFSGEEKIKKMFLLARHRNVSSCQKMKKVILLTFASSAKPLINVTFWARFFDPNRKKAIFPLLGAKK